MTVEEIAEKYSNMSIQGWRPDYDHAKRFAASNPTPVLSLAAPNLMAATPAEEIFLPRFLEKACLELYGPSWRYAPQFQKRGTCVGQSHKTGIDIVMGVNRFISGTEFVGRSAVAPNYAGGRVEIGHNPGTWDGSNGSWNADWLTKYGIVLLKELGLPEDALDTDEQYAVQWAARRDGVPAEYETAAKLKPVQSASLVQTVEEVVAAINALCYVNICSSYIPSPNRDTNGVSRMSIQGGHSTGIVGYRKVNGQYVFPYMQSWGNWAKGNYGWEKWDPNGMFRSTIVDITANDLAKVLRSRDCYAFTGLHGFELVTPGYFV